MHTKLSNIQVAELTKLAGTTIRTLSTENNTLRSENADLKTKVAAFEKRARAEKIAESMEAKGLNPDVPYGDKVTEILARENLEVLEEAVGMAAPQTKLAFVHEDGVEVESSGDKAVDQATQAFAAALASTD